MIEIKELTKKFGNTVAVDNLTLSIPEGEFFAFLGPNGAGKTTTIKIIAGLLRPTQGSVFVGGYSMTSKAIEAKRLISYVPDVPYVYEKLTGREFLYFTGELYNIDRQHYQKEIERLLGLFSMQDYGDMLMENYSHGMKQKVVICSALLHDPRLIVIDEPMVGLDPRSVRLVKDILKERSRQGTAIFMATHTLSLAEEIADRVGIIHNGRLISLGTVDEIKMGVEDSVRLEDVFLKITAEE
ncbi:ABC transporter ATP-binding protein [bacterium]|nr:ABC transporter ATP-binding protein [bacterium]